jgi:hypothetical protein
MLSFFNFVFLRRFFTACLCVVSFSHSQAQAFQFSTQESYIRAVRFDDIQTVENLIAAGTDPNAAEPQRGETALMICVREGSEKVIAYLLKHQKTNLNARANNGDSALMLAAYLHQLEHVQQLLEAGAQVNQTGWTALHYAAASGDAEIISLLLAHKADINAASPNKTTPLMMAARKGDTPVVKILLDAGADISLQNMSGLNALDFAIESEKHEVEAYLRAMMQKLKN